MAEKLHLSFFFSIFLCCFAAKCQGEASGGVTVLPDQESLVVCNDVAINVISVCTGSDGINFFTDGIKHQHVAFLRDCDDDDGETCQQFMVYANDIARLEVRLIDGPLKTYLITTSIERPQQVMDTRNGNSMKRHNGVTSFKSPSVPHITIRSALIQVDMYICGAPSDTLRVTASFQNSSSGGGGVFEECRSTTPSVMHQDNSTSCARFSFCIDKMGVQNQNLTNATFIMTAGVHLSDLDQSFTFGTGDCPVPNKEGPSGQPSHVLTPSDTTVSDVYSGAQGHGRTVTLSYITLLAMLVLFH